MRTLLCIVPLISLFCASCAERDTRDVTAPVTRTPDLVAEEGGIVAGFYDTTNPFTESTLQTTVITPVVARAIARFEGVGYEYRAEHSFVIEGSIDGRDVMMSVLTLINTTDDMTDAINVVCAREKEQWLVIPLRVTQDGAQSLAYGDGHAIMTLEALDPTPSIRAAAPGTAAFGWKRWGRCVAKRMAGATVGCLISCRWVPMVYLKCMAICTGAQTAATLVSCTIAEM
jgi:hypothetical protein